MTYNLCFRSMTLRSEQFWMHGAYWVLQYNGISLHYCALLISIFFFIIYHNAFNPKSLAAVHTFQKSVAERLNMTGTIKIVARAAVWMWPLYSTWSLSAVKILTAYFKHYHHILQIEWELFISLPFTEFINKPFITVFLL